VIETMLGLALAGKRPAAIARRLNDAGWQTKPMRRGDLPLPWSTGKVIERLRNPRYAGLQLYDGGILARCCGPPYISERQHERLRAKLTKRRPTKAPRQLETYLLPKLAVCGRCGRRIHAFTGLERGDGSFARRYVCAGHKK
jgi:hypothetical protein